MLLPFNMIDTRDRQKKVDGKTTDAFKFLRQIMILIDCDKRDKVPAYNFLRLFLKKDNFHITV